MKLFSYISFFLCFFFLSNCGKSNNESAEGDTTEGISEEMGDDLVEDPIIYLGRKNFRLTNVIYKRGNNNLTPEEKEGYKNIKAFEGLTEFTFYSNGKLYISLDPRLYKVVKDSGKYYLSLSESESGRDQPVNLEILAFTRGGDKMVLKTTEGHTLTAGTSARELLSANNLILEFKNMGPPVDD